MDVVEVVRRFNRTYTQRIGALDESFLGLGLPLGLARLIFEVAAADAADSRGSMTALELRRRLELDSGHLARQLRALEQRGLVDVLPDPTDRRRRVVRLTRAGADMAMELEDRSNALANNLVAPLTPRQRTRLLDALATADLLVRAATVDVSEVEARSPQARAAAGAYFEELDRRFPNGFDVHAAQAEDLRAPDSSPMRFVVASSDGQNVACGGVRALGTPHPPGTVEIKRMWVDPEWRGAGLGSRLLRHLEALAIDMGAREVLLDTNGTLSEAVAMYKRAGYREIGRYNDNPYAEAFFAKTLRT